MKQLAINPLDWISNESATMTTTQEGAYIRLLSRAAADESLSIPADDETLAAICGVTAQEWVVKFGPVRRRFVPHPSLPDRLQSPLVLVQAQKMADLVAKKRLAGAKSAQIRYGKPSKQSTSVQSNRCSTGAEQVLNTSSTGVRPAVIFPLCILHLSVDFTSPKQAAESIYNAYPRKVGRPNAVREIVKLLDRYCPQCLLEKVEAYARARATEDPAYTPYPATWFKAERFNDDPSTWTSKPKATIAPNPRNAGMSAEAIGRGQKYAEHLKRRERTTEASSNPVATQMAQARLL